jgi:hypothetical protein
MESEINACIEYLSKVIDTKKRQKTNIEQERSELNKDRYKWFLRGMELNKNKESIGQAEFSKQYAIAMEHFRECGDKANLLMNDINKLNSEILKVEQMLEMVNSTKNMFDANETNNDPETKELINSLKNAAVIDINNKDLDMTEHVKVMNSVLSPQEVEVCNAFYKQLQTGVINTLLPSRKN